jgi:signal transduction histidine kinase
MAHRQSEGERRSFVACPAFEPRVASHAEAIEQIVHDLKNPLGNIALETCLLDETAVEHAHHELRPGLARITRNVAFLERMVQDLLDAATIASGHFEIHRRPTELRALLERIVERIVSTRDRDRVALEAPCPVTLSLDELRIERVVANLVHNALKYTPRGSPVAIRLDVVHGHARVSVSDAGPGMTAAEASFVFEKYRRAASAHAFEGSGLGLHVSKQIVEAHAGTIGVDSTVGVGSRFHFELPMT